MHKCAAPQVGIGVVPLPILKVPRSLLGLAFLQEHSPAKGMPDPPKNLGAHGKHQNNLMPIIRDYIKVNPITAVDLFLWGIWASAGPFKIVGGPRIWQMATGFEGRVWAMLDWLARFLVVICGIWSGWKLVEMNSE